jgi:glucans biosynthesis protein C
MDTSNKIIIFRSHDLDNLRSFLTCLVIAHHTSIVYGGGGSWYFKSACFTSAPGLLRTFEAVNQSFFMGLFFWISGRMSA